MGEFQMVQWGWVNQTLSKISSCEVKTGFDFYFAQKLANKNHGIFLQDFLRRIYSISAHHNSLLAIVGGSARNNSYRSDIDIWINTRSGEDVESLMSCATLPVDNQKLTFRKFGTKIGVYRHSRKLIDIHISLLNPYKLPKMVKTIKGHLYSAIIPSTLVSPDHTTPYLHINPPKLTHPINIV